MNALSFKRRTAHRAIGATAIELPFKFGWDAISTILFPRLVRALRRSDKQRKYGIVQPAWPPSR
ncbi:hypothetical protein CGLAMM_09895 [Acetobacteraceae bacterium EV16G]|uniref:Uncharacterized protein n=1 Tax=Sorlinia euscelidii TaxID=3081148 RepID=A0ABU7U3R6_9PROT